MLPPSRNLKIGVTYVLFGSVLSILASIYNLKVPMIRVFLMGIWMGFVLAISFMEGWLKFKAPFVARHLAIDVGRMVFPALNAAECGLCISQWILLSQHADLDSYGMIYLFLLSVLLSFQMCLLTPRMVLRGKVVIYEEESKKPMNRAKKDQLRALQEEINQHKDHLPNSVHKDHAFYAIGEIMKIVLGVLFLGQYLLS